MKNQIDENECCPKFDPAPWNEKTFHWDNKKFIQDRVRTFFYIPLNFGSVMTRSVKKIEDAKAKMLEGVVLSESTSKWNMDLYIAVDQHIHNAENTTMNGKFVSKVYEGSFQNMGIWMKDFEQFAQAKKLSLTKTYMWYTTCPQCAKKYGKNYVVIVGKLAD
ncbi:MAG: hypothetical protein UX04_C0002G0060 [Microgenomates group bacterium GW2011_GWF2_45_18]|nr:MAG: hypothetical protein UW18_C0001G0037 [Microgenomates group bacterium GW2011_GWF1_44_10]KKU01917.1 MAG: hypothetical protein UX04_C0002G0060 [Microgenomates group bacterium GW2011_GWF2_45_18]OGJ40235.1 MAG: hypothetical protein A2378_03365 [Candidatus Pacebacteria bacterium RIFOXYB1_FULL_44_10]HAU98768.1 hypothetical protein [Candidatus Paceibacterota bacterium]HAX01412.1 hypothetical protein [Candidatus Paceibacterota bacterium]